MDNQPIEDVLHLGRMKWSVDFQKEIEIAWEDYEGGETYFWPTKDQAIALKDFLERYMAMEGV